MSDTTRTIADADLQDLRTSFLGEISTADAPGYDEARAVWNACIDRKPAVIVRPKTTDDVTAAVRFAKQQGLTIAVRGGGHSAPGFSSCDGGMVIDLRAIADVAADPATKTVRVGGGALLGDVDIAAQAHGMAVPVGVVGHTGVGGLTLGGGLGRLHRKYGLTIDNLISCEMVTADGRVVRASEDENPELFWGLRGAGANFGIVTSFEFRMHEIGTMIHSAMQMYTMENAAEAITGFSEWFMSAPDEVMGAAMLTRIPPGGPFPEQLVGKQVLMAPGMYLGDASEVEAALAPMATFSTPMFAGFMQMPYLALQTMADEFYAWGKRYYIKGAYLQQPTREVAEILVNAYLASPGEHCEVQLLPMGGAIAKVAEDATAFSGRRAPFFVGIDAQWTDPSEDALYMGWARETFEALRPHFAPGNYVNAAEAADDIRAVYGDAKYERLVALKREWDPENVFRINANIKP
jgi:hypothetical protein